MRLILEQETLTSLAQATAVIGVGDEVEKFLRQIGACPEDTVTLDGARNGGIGEVHHLAAALLLTPQFGPVRLGVITAADRLSLPAQNALLKLLEEPPPQAKLILWLEQEEGLAPTVLSRCRRYYLAQPLGSGNQPAWPTGSLLDQFLAAEELAGDPDLSRQVINCLAHRYSLWEQAHRPAHEALALAAWHDLYCDLAGSGNKRLTLEQFMLLSPSE